MIDISPAKKKLVLGTALWGWGVTREEAYSLLENYLQCGGSIVDTATNYPINKCKDDIGLAIRWLEDWKSLHPKAKLSLIVKVGSKDNMGGSDVDLSPSCIIDTTKRLRDVFEDSLSCVSIHWDDRVDEGHGRNGISQTVEAMSRIRETGLDVGLSGIKKPRFYYTSNPNLSGDWIIQVKENFITNKARLAYEKYFPCARYLAYGVNMGGVKIEGFDNNSSVSLRGIKVDSLFVDRIKSFLESDHGIDPRPADFNQLSLAFSYCNASLAGVVIGPRSIRQLENSVGYWMKLEKSTEPSEWLRCFDGMSKRD